MFRGVNFFNSLARDLSAQFKSKRVVAHLRSWVRIIREFRGNTFVVYWRHKKYPMPYMQPLNGLRADYSNYFTRIAIFRARVEKKKQEKQRKESQKAKTIKAKKNAWKKVERTSLSGSVTKKSLKTRTYSSKKVKRVHYVVKLGKSKLKRYINSKVDDFSSVGDSSSFEVNDNELSLADSLKALV